MSPVLIAGCLIIMTGFAIRASFGVFQIPIADEFGWARAEFSLAIAIQNLAWGIGQPIFGAIAEKIGDRKAIILGALAYATGLLLSAGATSPIAHQAYEVLVGFGIAGTGFGVILAVVGRAASDENRSMALAISNSCGIAGTSDRGTDCGNIARLHDMANGFRRICRRDYCRAHGPTDDAQPRSGKQSRA